MNTYLIKTRSPKSEYVASKIKAKKYFINYHAYHFIDEHEDIIFSAPCKYTIVQQIKEKNDSTTTNSL